jgi:ABC-type thiamine transport system ATPase subunit
MTKQERPFEFTSDAREVGHTAVFGPVGAGKSVFPAGLLALWGSGHPGGISSIGQAGVVDAVERLTKRQVGKGR